MNGPLGGEGAWANGHDAIRLSFVDAYKQACTVQVTADGRLCVGLHCDSLRAGFPWWEMMPFGAVAQVLAQGHLQVPAQGPLQWPAQGGGPDVPPVCAVTHMLLGVEQVDMLIPLLEDFAETGKVTLPDTTSHGFGFMQFADTDGLRCSLQESSAAVPHVWLGPMVYTLQVGGEAVPLREVRAALVAFWEAYDAHHAIERAVDVHGLHVRGSLDVSDRMHLSRAQVAALLPSLRAYSAAVHVGAGVVA